MAAWGRTPQPPQQGVQRSCAAWGMAARHGLVASMSFF